MTTDGNYVEEYLPPHLVEKLEAGAFRSLCSHLQERSDAVQNIDLMSVSGFCRNCLAKVSLSNMLLLLYADNDDHYINDPYTAVDGCRST